MAEKGARRKRWGRGGVGRHSRVKGRMDESIGVGGGGGGR